MDANLSAPQVRSCAQPTTYARVIAHVLAAPADLLTIAVLTPHAK